jgi:protein gp37
MSRMFRSVTTTWNPQVGCLYGCVYCWARELAETKLKGTSRYKNGFRPLFIGNELRKCFKPGEFVFVSDMGDLFGWWVPVENIISVLACIAKWPQTTFLLQTKNPSKFLDVLDYLPPNVYLGTTIETNHYQNKVTDAPSPFIRYFMISDRVLRRWKKFISIEPIMDFDLNIMLDRMKDIKPDIIEIGADNYGHNLPEPSWDKISMLIAELERFCPHVEQKQGLDRLRR